MAKSNLTTAKHRNLAWDAEQQKDWKNAFKHTSLAIHKYPKQSGQLDKADIANLKERLKYFRSRIKSG